MNLPDQVILRIGRGKLGKRAFKQQIELFVSTQGMEFEQLFVNDFGCIQKRKTRDYVLNYPPSGGNAVAY